MRTFTLILVLGSVLGCAGAPEPQSGAPVVAQASTADQTCSRDSECVLVQDCCGCARQGRQLAVHRDRVEALVAESQATCSAQSCIVQESQHRSCRASQAVCRGGICIPAAD